MIQWLRIGLLGALLIAGCASQPPRGVATLSSGEPEIVLPGGELEHARLLAMGMALSKGWKPVEIESQRLLLERSLPANAPQARLLSSDPSTTPPKLRVETRLTDRQDGVLVALRAFIATNPGTEAEQQIDYTEDYQDELLISLNALASGWLANRDRIASEIPLPPDPDAVVIAASDADGDDPSPATADAAVAEPDAQPGPESAAAERREDTATDQSAPAAGGATAGGDAATAPIASATAPPSANPLPSTLSGAPTLTSGNNPMLALDDQPRRGLWAFYAEASARERGCAVGERGAVLLNTSPDFELHEVQCNGGRNLLLRCQGGICREVN